MATRDMVKDLTSMNLKAESFEFITHGTGLHNQKESNLCVYFATMSAIRHAIKKIIKNSTSTAINMRNEYPSDKESIFIPAGKSIDELFKKEEFQFVDGVKNETKKFQNALSYERMLSVLLGCVNPRALSGMIKSLNIYFKIILFLETSII